nr:unnamed protein product [Spirometra erinaceieuropaei]
MRAGLLNRGRTLGIGCWNVRTFLDPGTQSLTARSLHQYNVDVCCLSEVRLPDSGSREIKIPGVESHFTLYHSGLRDSSGRHGVAIALSQQADLALLAWKPVNNRMAYVRLKGNTCCSIGGGAGQPVGSFGWFGESSSSESEDLKAWTRACLGCQRNKVRRHNKTPIGTFPTPDARFSHIHLDIVGPLPLSNGCFYLLTCVDGFTRWPEAIPLPDVAAPTVVKAFLSRWVAIFGAPSIITTDRGAQFESHLFQSLLSFLGCTRIRTTAYHPAANGMVERFHRQLKASLRAADYPENWTDHLPLVLLGIRSSLKSDLDCSAAELVFGASVRLPGQMISPTPRVAVEDPTNLLHRLRQFLRTLSPVPPRPSVSESYLEKDLATCSHVYLRCDRVRRPLESPYDGPFRVISRGTKNFRIQRGTREEVVSVDRLKAAVPDTPPDEPCGPLPPAPPPRLSIPPSRILPLPSCPQLPTATTPSSTNNTTSTVPLAPLRATFGLAGGYCGGSRLLAFRLCHAAVLSASHSVSIRSRDARVLEANQRCPHSDWLADVETTKGARADADNSLLGARLRRLPTQPLCTRFASSKVCPSQTVFPDF